MLTGPDVTGVACAGPLVTPAGALLELVVAELALLPGTVLAPLLAACAWLSCTSRAERACIACCSKLDWSVSDDVDDEEAVEVELVEVGFVPLLEVALVAVGGAVVNAMLDPSLLVMVVVVEPFALVVVVGVTALEGTDEAEESWLGAGPPEVVAGAADCSTNSTSKMPGLNAAWLPLAWELDPAAFAEAVPVSGKLNCSIVTPAPAPAKP